MTDGAFSDDGVFHSLEWDADAVMKLFRERLLVRLIERHAISEDLARKLLAWRHPGFSAHVGEAIPFEDKKAIEEVACYVVRNPLSLKKQLEAPSSPFTVPPWPLPRMKTPIVRLTKGNERRGP